MAQAGTRCGRLKWMAVLRSGKRQCQYLRVRELPGLLDWYYWDEASAIMLWRRVGPLMTRASFPA